MVKTLRIIPWIGWTLAATSLALALWLAFTASQNQGESASLLRYGAVTSLVLGLLFAVSTFFLAKSPSFPQRFLALRLA